MQKVIKRVQSSLSDLKLAIDGTIVMSPALKESLDAMYDARIPESWMKISWESTTLGFWYTELLERNSQFCTWINTDRPKVCIFGFVTYFLNCFLKVFWMTGFFNCQGFLTAMRQVSFYEIFLLCKGFFPLSCKKFKGILRKENDGKTHLTFECGS